MRAVMGVRVRPGATQFTRMPLGAYVAAALSAMAATPPLAAAMASWLAMPWRATAEEQKAIEPPPPRIICLTAALST